MTDNMTVKEALAVVIEAANDEAETCDVQFATRHAETIRQAIDVLRNGSAKAEKSDRSDMKPGRKIMIHCVHCNMDWVVADDKGRSCPACTAEDTSKIADTDDTERLEKYDRIFNDRKKLRTRITELEVENLALRCCGNCKHSGTVGARKECVGCYGFSDVDFEDSKEYPAKWVKK